MLRSAGIKRYFLTAFFLGFTCFASPALSNGQLMELSAAQRLEALDKIKSIQKNVHSIKASVIQEKQISSLKQKVVIEGVVTMSKPNMVRWDILKPERSLTAIDGEKMTVYHPDLKEAQIYNMSENIIVRNAMSFFAVAIGGDLTEMEKKFTVNIFLKDEKIIFKLVPLSQIEGKYISAITIYYDERSALPDGFDITTPKGDKTTIKLSNMQINPELKSDTFSIKLASDVWITNKSEERNGE